MSNRVGPVGAKTADPGSFQRSRMMARPLEAPRISAIRIATDLYRAQGLRGFYSGFLPSALRAFPVNSCAYFVYEGLMRNLDAEIVS